MSGLDAQALRHAPDRRLIGRAVVVLEKATSTNDVILDMAARSATEGLVVFAEHQTAGRGQRYNRWESPAHKGLWFSILLQPKIEIGESARLTAWAAQAVANSISEQFSLAATVKEPNDVLIEGRKVAGVLVEMRARKNAPHLAIAGIGINVNQTAEDFPAEIRSRAVSLAMLLDREVDRNKLAAALLRDLDRSYAALFCA
jgi:BirA family biotin operon repressor/biotin-[acetyl-CoA-carboxylase] ligase